MADMIVEYRVMPEDGEVEFSTLEGAVKNAVQSYKEDVKILNSEEEEVAFGLKAVRIKFQMDENHGCDGVEEALMALPEVGEVEATLMDRL